MKSPNIASPEGQRALDTMRDKIAADLLEPLGLKPPRIPVMLVPPWELSWDTAASTHFNLKTDRQPSDIKISTLQNSVVDVAAVLAHEMIHSALPWEVDNCENDGHGPTFERYARAIGLGCDITGTCAGPKFIDWYEHALAPLVEPK